MATVTITQGATTIAPNVLAQFRSTRSTGTAVHAVVGAATVDVVSRPAGLRRGTLTLVFATDEDSLEAEQLHTLGTVLTLVSSVGSVDMLYVADGQIVRERTATEWILSVDFQEVPA